MIPKTNSTYKPYATWGDVKKRNDCTSSFLKRDNNSYTRGLLGISSWIKHFCSRISGFIKEQWALCPLKRTMRINKRSLSLWLLSYINNLRYNSIAYPARLVCLTGKTKCHPRWEIIPTIMRFLWNWAEHIAKIMTWDTWLWLAHLVWIPPLFQWCSMKKFNPSIYLSDKYNQI